MLHGTCVIKDSVFDGAVLKEGVGWSDILKVAVFKQRILKLHRLNFNFCKPKQKDTQKNEAIIWVNDSNYATPH